MKILIAYNNDQWDQLSGFFESCAEEIESVCKTKQIKTTCLTPPHLDYSSIAEILNDFPACVIAAHGDERSIANEKNKDIVSTDTDNSIYNNKLLYAISCSCAKQLKGSLMENGLKSFWGYQNKLNFWSGYPSYVKCAVSGMVSLIEGKTIKEAKEDMLAQYDSSIVELSATETDPLVAAYLLDNKESLVITGDDNLTIDDLL